MIYSWAVGADNSPLHSNYFVGLRRDWFVEEEEKAGEGEGEGGGVWDIYPHISTKCVGPGHYRRHHHHLLPVPSYNNNDPFQAQHLADLCWVTITSHQDMVAVTIKIPDLEQIMQRQNQRKRKETKTAKME